jgi:hypothetical protein
MPFSIDAALREALQPLAWPSFRQAEWASFRGAFNLKFWGTSTPLDEHANAPA